MAESIGALVAKVAAPKPVNIGAGKIGYSEQIADRICAELQSGKSLRSICKQEGFPNKATVFDWLRNREDFRSKYEFARDVQAHEIFEQMMEVAGDRSRDVINGKPNNAAIGRDRLIWDNLKWFLAVNRPKIYGEHSSVSVDARIETVDLTDFEIARRLAFLQDKLARAKTIDHEPKTMNKEGTGI